jgi:hypothetical protein
MKKLAIGCGIVLVLCCVSVGALMVYGYYKVQQYTASLKQFAEITQLNQQVANKASFTAPSNGELTDDVMRRFVAVQESMTAKLGKRVEELNTKANEFQRLQQSEHRDASASEVFTMVRDLMNLVLEAKTAQVAALNASHFSLEEYDWTRQQVYAAAGMSIAAFNFEKMQEAMKNASNGDVEASRNTLQSDVPERNKNLVQPYLPKLKEWAPFAFFGL